jgi:hypothetical protein
MSAPMRFAYADPPYIGMAKKHYAHDPQCAEVNHAELVERLRDEFPDGWALSCSSVSLEEILHITRRVLGPKQVRIGAWVKPFHVFKKGVRPAYAWEPIVFRGGRNAKHPPPVKGGKATTPRDWVSANITLRRGLVGAKPELVCFWLFDILGARPCDTLSDLYPGTGGVLRAWDLYVARQLYPDALDSDGAA